MEATARSRSDVFLNWMYFVQCSSLMSNGTTGEDLRDTARFTVVIICMNNNRRALRSVRSPSVRRLTKVLQLGSEMCVELTSSPTNER